MNEFLLRLGFSVLVGLAITAGLVLAAREYVQCRREGSSFANLNVRLSLSTLGPNVLIYLVLAPWWALVYQQIAESTSQSLSINVASLVIAFLACDLSYYIEHRCAHKFRILWRLYHGTHHNSDVYNIPLAYRVNFVSQFFSPLFYLPWLFLGLHPLVVLGFQLFVFHYQAWIHTESIGRLGFLDQIINTAANHRMHHSCDPAHQAVNLGGVTMLWDRLFRTYCPPQDEVIYGISDTPATTTYSGIYLDPWRNGFQQYNVRRVGQMNGKDPCASKQFR